MNNIMTFSLNSNVLVKSPVPNELLMQSTYVDALESMCNSMLESLTVVFIVLLGIAIVKQVFRLIKFKNLHYKQLNSLWKNKVSLLRKS